MTVENLPPKILQSKSLTNIPYAEIMCDQPSLNSSSSSELCESEPCELRFRNLKTHPVAGCGSRFALNNVSGVVKPGQLLAVMGQTGCGKTTLLNTLAGRLRIAAGTVCLNGEPISKRLRRKRIGYVLQQDVFFPTLTLKQTLIYTALLRLSDVKFSKKDKIQKVEDIIEILDLYRCQHNPVGDGVTIRGISGGERKRLSIACELITNPSILLIDEPTSGLDSSTAQNLMQTLKHYAQKTGKNVVLTVHQPSSRIFKMFDLLLALSNGETAYFGPASEMTTHMATLGLQIEPDYNPADFLLEKLTSDSSLVLTGWKDHPTNLSKNELNNFILGGPGEDNGKIHYPLSIASTSSGGRTTSTWPTSFCTQVKVLTRRNFQLAVPRTFSKIYMIQTLVLGFLSGLTWFQIPRTEENFKNLEGWMFFSTNYWMLFVLFMALWAFPAERPIIHKERQSGAYRFSAYYVAKILGEAPLEIVLPSIYLLISYPLMGGTLTAFLGILSSQILSSLACQSIGFFMGSVMTVEAATTLAAIFTVMAQLLGGFLTTNVPSYFKVTSVVYNGLRNLQYLEFNYGYPISCAVTVPSEFPSCRNVTLMAEGALQNIGAVDLFYKGEIGFLFPWWTHSLVLVGFIILFRVLSYITLSRIL